MKHGGDIPEPTESGSTGAQREGSVEIVPSASESPLVGLPITQALEGLAASKSRSLGGELPSALIVASFRERTNDLQIARQDLTRSREEVRTTREQLFEARTRIAVLEERVTAYTRERHLKIVSVAIGTFLLTSGFEAFKQNIPFLIVFGILGLVLILLGWFYKQGRTDG